MVEDVLDLADPGHGHPGLDQEIENGRRRRRHRVVPALRPPDERARTPLERPRDHAANEMGLATDPARGLAPVVELPERHHIDMGRDLEHRVSARVDDRLACPQVLGAELGDDRGPGRRHVAEHATPDR